MQWNINERKEPANAMLLMINEDMKSFVSYNNNNKNTGFSRYTIRLGSFEPD